MKWLACSLLSLFYVPYAHSVQIIQASDLSCGAPTMVTETAIVELDIALEITGLCELLVAAPSFGIGDTITFRVTAPDGRIDINSTVVLNAQQMIVVTNPGIWDVRSFTQPTQQFIFEDVIITLAPGASILADGVTFRLTGQSKIITEPVTIPTP